MRPQLVDHRLDPQHKKLISQMDTEFVTFLYEIIDSKSEANNV